MLLTKKDPNLLMKIGMLALALAGSSRLFLHPAGWLTENRADAMNGFLYGIAIAMMLLGLWQRRKLQRTN